MSDRRAGRVHAQADRGAVTAEVAVTLPVLVLVLVACLGGLLAATDLARLHDVAADAARLLSRGESSVVQHVERALPGASVTIERPAGLVCVHVQGERRILGLPLPLRAFSCALDGGR